MNVMIPHKGMASWIAPLALTAAVAALTLKVGPALAHRITAWQGTEMNENAWKANYRERGLPVPQGGPRDGYWGARIGTSIPDPVVGWTLPPLDFPHVLEVAPDGSQTVSSGTGPAGAAASIVIMGGSTAFGAYASDERRTYFGVLSTALANAGVPNRIHVLATGAWKSSQSVPALQRALARGARPSLIVFVNGLNDLTNGSSASTLFGVETKTTDGSDWTMLYNEHDWDARVRLYLENMERATTLAAQAHAGLLLVLQPALFEKHPLSERESDLLEASLEPLGPVEPLVESYERMRRGLAALARRPGVSFVDCSRAFDGDEATTFTDMWHFADPGHAKLAACMQGALERLARDRPEPETTP